jgi:hypothetical protein
MFMTGIIKKRKKEKEGGKKRKRKKGKRKKKEKEGKGNKKMSKQSNIHQDLAYIRTIGQCIAEHRHAKSLCDCFWVMSNVLSSSSGPLVAVT